MKVALMPLKGNSGNDVYFQLLKKGLDKYTKIKSDVFFLPAFLEKVPFLYPYYLNKFNLKKYDIIHTNAEFGHYFKIKDKKLFVTIHHLIFDEQYQKYTSFFQKIFHYLWIKPNLKKTLKVADKVVAVSNFTAKSVKKYFNLKRTINTIYNGIDTDIFKFESGLKNKNKPYRLIFIGNQSKRKGRDIVCEVMKKLGKDYQLYYAGLRNDKTKYLEKYNMYCLGKLSIKQLVQEYNKANALFFPSRLEGFGYSIAESIACGTPVVTTNYSSMKEIVIDGKNGFLCKMDDMNEFIKKIKEVETRVFDKDVLRNSILHFDLKNLAKNYEKICT